MVQIDADTDQEERKTQIKRLESFLEVLPASTIANKLGLQMSRLLRQYRARKANEAKYAEQVWL